MSKRTTKAESWLAGGRGWRGSPRGRVLAPARGQGCRALTWARFRCPAFRSSGRGLSPPPMTYPHTCTAIPVPGGFTSYYAYNITSGQCNPGDH